MAAYTVNDASGVTAEAWLETEAKAIPIPQSHKRLKSIAYGVGPTLFLLVGAAVFYGVEAANVDSFWDGLYFATVTTTSVGYGDISPVTSEGKVLVVLYAFLGLGATGALLSLLAEQSSDRVSKALDMIHADALSADPYIRLTSLNGKTVLKTPTVYNEINPVWHAVEWIISAEEFCNKGVLALEVMDKDRWTADDLIGTAYLELTSSQGWKKHQVEVKHRINLSPRKDRKPPPTPFVNVSTLHEGNQYKIHVSSASNIPAVDGTGLGKLYSASITSAVTAVAIMSFLVCSGGLLFSSVEGWRFFDGMYFSFVTISAIGYGDFSPKTTEGRILLVPFVLLAMATNGFAMKIITDLSVNRATSSFVANASAIEIEALKDPALEQAYWSTQGWQWTLKAAFTLALTAAFVLLGAGLVHMVEGWDYGMAVYFCVVTLTTVGYGDIFPRTDGGKVVVMIYAVFGLGLMSTTVALLSENSVMMTAKAAERTAAQGIQDGGRSKKMGQRKRMCGVLLLLLAVILLGAAGFYGIEPGTFQHAYGNAVYFCFITMTTIGYGDFYPGTDAGRVLCVVYVLFGLGIMSLCLSKLQQTAAVSLKQGLSKIKQQPFVAGAPAWVTEMLKPLGLEEYEDNFTAHSIHEESALSLDVAALRFMGIQKVGHCIRIHQALQKKYAPPPGGYGAVLVATDDRLHAVAAPHGGDTKGTEAAVVVPAAPVQQRVVVEDRRRSNEEVRLPPLGDEVRDNHTVGPTALPSRKEANDEPNPDLGKLVNDSNDDDEDGTHGQPIGLLSHGKTSDISDHDDSPAEVQARPLAKPIPPTRRMEQIEYSYYEYSDV